MSLSFYKYQGTGNDFVVIDNRDGSFPAADVEGIAHLCDRRFGVGADGLMLLQDVDGYDFEMLYFNADGKLGSMCGNGARCIVAFAHFLGLFDTETHFLAVDGPHQGRIKGNQVQLLMQDVANIEQLEADYFLDTGSPHYVKYVDGLKDFDVVKAGKAIRYNNRFSSEGTNVNFLELLGDRLYIRTYERGVEDETYSCGTGVVASAITAHHKGLFKDGEHIQLSAVGGELCVRLQSSPNGGYREIWLEGPATFVFEGTLAG